MFKMADSFIIQVGDYIKRQDSKPNIQFLGRTFTESEAYSLLVKKYQQATFQSVVLFTWFGTFGPLPIPQMNKQLHGRHSDTDGNNIIAPGNLQVTKTPTSTKKTAICLHHWSYCMKYSRGLFRKINAGVSKYKILQKSNFLPKASCGRFLPSQAHFLSSPAEIMGCYKSQTSATLWQPKRISWCI